MQYQMVYCVNGSTGNVLSNNQNEMVRNLVNLHLSLLTTDASDEDLARCSACITEIPNLIPGKTIVFEMKTIHNQVKVEFSVEKSG